MRAVFLYGAPGAGKLAVGIALGELRAYARQLVRWIKQVGSW
jgi:hypothetical protein